MDDDIIENLVALRLNHRTIRNFDPLHGLVIAAEAVTDMEASRFREALKILKAVPPTALDRKYRAAREAVLTWASGDIQNAREMLALSLPYLTGEAALFTGFLVHMADFYLGDEKGMLETGNLLIELRSTMTRRAAGLSDGLVSFAQEENGHYPEAISLAEQALSINHDDVYALHAKVHALQKQHEHQTARTIISRYSNGWSALEPMRIHMWWHFAISLIEEGELDQALLCYDLELRRKRYTKAWEDLDAVTLLWRLDILGGKDISEVLASRWRMLALAWEDYTADPIYIFNDLHAAMTFAKVEDYHLFDKVVNACRARETPDFFHFVCEPVFLGLVAFAQRDYATTVKLMNPVLKRPQLLVGGSKAQQSIFYWTRDAANSYLRGSNPHDFLYSHTQAFTKET